MFNIFEVLEKDDKELIHSSFIKFLLKEDTVFAEEMLGVQLTKSCDIQLEKSHTLKIAKKKKKQFRFDIEIIDSKTVIIIENKFKSFPSALQLNDYDKVIEQDFDGEPFKFLLCFDKNLFDGKKGWIVIDYGDILPLIKDCKNRIDNADKKLFIQHYIDFLSKYYSIYNSLDEVSYKYFLNQSDKVSKFWIRLIYSKLVLRFEKYFTDNNLNVFVGMDTGNTKIPLINIVPHHWNIHGHELLIQFQEGLIKFYAHTSDKDFIQDMVDYSRSHINSENVDFKKRNNKKEKTAFIFRLKIQHIINKDSRLSEDELFNHLLSFYHIVNDKVIKTYKIDKGLK